LLSDTGTSVAGVCRTETEFGSVFTGCEDAKAASTIGFTASQISRTVQPQPRESTCRERARSRAPGHLPSRCCRGPPQPDIFKADEIRAFVEPSNHLRHGGKFSRSEGRSAHLNTRVEQPVAARRSCLFGFRINGLSALSVAEHSP